MSPAEAGTGPLRAILVAREAGAATVEELAAASGCPMEVVRAGMAHLGRLGLLSTAGTTVGCASIGCGGCPVLGMRRRCPDGSST